ncbi:MAG: hypothetical protein H7Y38_18485 [Armatimonadetes bacterium]|nr:hypothetical protein [Armatimonadota bacterium]
MREVDNQRERLDRIESELLCLTQEVRDMGDAMRYLHDQQVRERDREDARREQDAARYGTLALRLENTLLRAGLGVLAMPPMDILPSGER